MTATSINIVDFRGLPGRLTDTTTYSFPTITTKPSKATDTKLLIYDVIVKLIDKNSGEFATILDSYFDSKTNIPDNLHGYIKINSRYNTNPEPRISSPTIVQTGKNLGRSNATNVWTQALRDALSLYNKQNKKAQGNTEKDVVNDSTSIINDSTSIINDSTSVISLQPPPMLAQKFKSNAQVVAQNGSARIFMQRKYNGVRAVAFANNKTISFYSRGRKEYSHTNLSQLIQELTPVLNDHPDLYLDGELYVHGGHLQDISGSARATGKKDINLEYLIYDCFSPKHPDMLFSERNNILKTIDSKYKLNQCKIVETVEVIKLEEIDKNYKKWLAEKYEGAMIRIDAKYQYSTNGYRSPNLLKLKPTLDEEFEIVGITKGEKGKSVGTLLFVFLTNEPLPRREFTVSPEGELEWRKKRYDELTMRDKNPPYLSLFEREYKGRKMRVEFEEYSKDGIPLRAKIPYEYIRPDDE